MHPFVIPTTLACLLAGATAAVAGGPRGHTLGADLSRLAPEAAAPVPDGGAARLAEDKAPTAGAPCPAEAATCAVPDTSLD